MTNVVNKLRPNFCRAIALGGVLVLGVSGFAVPVFSRSDDGTERLSELARVLSTDSAVNFAVRTQQPSDGQSLGNCMDILRIASVEDDVSAQVGEYAVSNKPVAAGTAVTCQLLGARGASAEFVVHGIN